MKKYEGSCHCGAVKFSASIEVGDSYICDCSICSRKGSIMNRVVSGDFQIIDGEGSLKTYKFNTQVGTHYFCGNCGIHTFHNPRSAPDIWSVNVRCIQEIDPNSLQPKQVHGSKLV